MKIIQQSSVVAMLCLAGGLSLSAATAEPSPENNAAVTRPARPPEDKEQLQRRLGSVGTLLETSSAAKQIDASGNPRALEFRSKARDLKKQADVSFQANNLPESSRLLDQAAKMLFEGARLAAPEQITGEKKQRDFDNRLESVKALLSAQKRISQEKNQGAKGIDITKKIEVQIGEATALAKAGKLDEGRAVLDQVYLITRTAVEGMRQGDTLVRSLQFANKEEEYAYEIDRNDTHKMLVKVLLDEKRASNPNLETMVQKYLEQAATIRVNAEAVAAKKDFEAGIKLLEDSTKELVRAIRGAGIYIPG